MLRGEQKKITNNNMSVCLHLEMQILQETECKIAKGLKSTQVTDISKLL